MADVRLKPSPHRSDIARVLFDLQEHKTHNNAALVMEHNYIKKGCNVKMRDILLQHHILKHEGA